MNPAWWSYVGDALYGLVGALGGAVIAAAAAYMGPLQVQRRTLEQVREEAERARLDQEAARAEARRLAEEEARAAEQREHVARARADRDAATARIIRIRTTTRDWEQLLDRYVQDLMLQHASTPGPSLRDFDEELQVVRRAAQSAVDEAVHDGLRLPQTPLSPVYIRSIGSEEPRPEDISATYALDRTSTLMRRTLLTQGAPTPEQISELEQSLDEARRARHGLNSLLMEAVERTVAPDLPSA